MGSRSESASPSEPDKLRWTKLSGSSGSVPILETIWRLGLQWQAWFVQKFDCRAEKKFTAAPYVGV